MPGIIILIAVVVLVVGYIITTQRQFINLGELSDNALSQIGVQQQSRWDALTQVAKAAKGYATHEKETLDSVIGARNPAPPKNAQDVMRDDNQFAEALSRFNVVVEQYPQLKADALYMKAMGSIEKYEENVRMSRMVFNDTVTKWNRLVKQIPSSFVAAIFGFSQRQYLETNQATANMPDLEF